MAIFVETVASNNDSICWKCQNACSGGCSWSRNFTPVKGWEANQNVIKEENGEKVISYLVKKCPQNSPFRQSYSRKGIYDALAKEFGISRRTVERNIDKYVDLHNDNHKDCENSQIMF